MSFHRNGSSSSRPRQQQQQQQPGCFDDQMNYGVQQSTQFSYQSDQNPQSIPAMMEAQPQQIFYQQKNPHLQQQQFQQLPMYNQMQQMKSNDGGKAKILTNNSAEDNEIFEDHETTRVEATEYNNQYGKKWKKLAKSYRDIEQPDGSIVREYIIEDSNMLRQLSSGEEDEEEMINRNGMDQSENGVKYNNDQQQQQQQSSEHEQSIKSKKSDKKKSRRHSKKDSTSSHRHRQSKQSTEKKSNGIQQREQQSDIVNKQQLNDEPADNPNIELPPHGSQFEIVDENGNVIPISGVEDMIRKASRMEEKKDGQGNLIREYVVDDPRLLQKISQLAQNQPISNQPPPPPPPQQQQQQSFPPSSQQQFNQQQQFIQPPMGQRIPPPPPPTQQQDYYRGEMSQNYMWNPSSEIGQLSNTIQNNFHIDAQQQSASSNGLPVQYSRLPIPPSSQQQQQQQQQQPPRNGVPSYQQQFSSFDQNDQTNTSYNNNNNNNNNINQQSFRQQFHQRSN